MHRSNKDGRASRPKAKRIKSSAPNVARLFKTLPAGAFLSPKLVTKLRYASVVSHSNGVADAGMYQFRLNSVYDPDFTGGGVQPPYFDKIAGLYNTYRVLSAKFRVRTMFATGGTQLVTAWTSASSTAVNSVSSAMCQTDADTIIVSAYTDANEGGFKKWISMAKAFGVERAEIETDSDYGALVTANPNKVAYLNLYSGNMTGTATSTCTSLVEISYYVEWSQPIPDNMN